MKILKNLKLITVNSNISISEAIKKITEHECRVLLVLKNKKIYGYLQEGDIKRALVQKKFTLKTKICKILNKKPFVVKNNLSLKNKIKKLKDSARLRAPIVNSDNNITGLIYFSNFENLYQGQNLDFKNSKKKRILLVGGAGYIGSVLATMLLKLNYYVIIYDLFKFGYKSISKIKKNKNLKVIKGDSGDTKKILKIAFGIDAIVDLSGIVGDPACELDPTKTIAENYFKSKNLAEIAKLLQIQKYIFISSCSVYGLSNGRRQIDEKTKENPISLYAECKLNCEKEILKLKEKNFCPIILRLATVFGYSPRQRFDLVANIFTLMVAQKKSIRVFGGKQFRPNIHVYDVAKAIRLVLDAPIKKVKNQIFNVGCNKLNLRILDLARIILKHNKSSNLKVEKDITDHRDYHVNFDKIRKILKFKTRFNIYTGTKELYKAIKNKKCKVKSKESYSNYNRELKDLYN